MCVYYRYYFLVKKKNNKMLYQWNSSFEIKEQLKTF